MEEELLIAIVGPKMEERYRILVRKQRIEADPSYIFCPRLICQAPILTPSPIVPTSPLALDRVQFGWEKEGVRVSKMVYINFGFISEIIN